MSKPQYFNLKDVNSLSVFHYLEREGFKVDFYFLTPYPDLHLDEQGWKQLEKHAQKKEASIVICNPTGMTLYGSLPLGAYIAGDVLLVRGDPIALAACLVDWRLDP